MKTPAVATEPTQNWIGSVRGRRSDSVERRGRTGYPGSAKADSLDKVATGGYIASMRSVGLKVLKNRLSEYIRLAASGETVLVTDRDRVVAEIVAPQTGRAEFVSDALLAEAVREGWLRPPTLAGGIPPRRPIMPFRDLMADLQDDREDR